MHHHKLNLLRMCREFRQQKPMEITVTMYRVFIKYCVLFFPRFRTIFQTLCQRVYTALHAWTAAPDGRSNTSAAAELAEFRKFQHLKEKNNI